MEQGKNNSEVVACFGEHSSNLWALAVNPGTREEVLEKLIGNGCVSLLERIAEHPNANANTLSCLARHPHPDVRAAVTSNAAASEDDLWKLAEDESADVRYALAENPHIAEAILRMLAEDEHPYVAHRAHTTLQRLRQVKLDILPHPGGNARKASQNFG
jgi:hypothetical protein